MGLALVLAGPDTNNRDRFPVWLMWAFLVFTGVSIFGYWSVMLFNRPKAVVAPHLRTQRGLIRARKEEPTRLAKPRRLPRIGKGGVGVLASFDVSPHYAIIEIGDKKARRVPQFDPDAEQSFVANAEMILIATRGAGDGDVHIRVVVDEPLQGSGHEVYSGRLLVPSGVLVVGNSLASEVAKVDISPARAARVRVLVEPALLPSSVDFEIMRLS
jgi:hypothetical protein